MKTQSILTSQWIYFNVSNKHYSISYCVTVLPDARLQMVKCNYTHQQWYLRNSLNRPPELRFSTSWDLPFLPCVSIPSSYKVWSFGFYSQFCTKCMILGVGSHWKPMLMGSHFRVNSGFEELVNKSWLGQGTSLNHSMNYIPVECKGTQSIHVFAGLMAICTSRIVWDKTSALGQEQGTPQLNSDLFPPRESMQSLHVGSMKKEDGSFGSNTRHSKVGCHYSQNIQVWNTSILRISKWNFKISEGFL